MTGTTRVIGAGIGRQTVGTAWSGRFHQLESM